MNSVLMGSLVERMSTGALRTGSLNTNRPSSEKEQKVEAAAVQFESVLLEEICSKLRNTFAQDEKEGASGAEGFSDLGNKYFALGLSRRGGLGITKFLIPYLRSADKPLGARLEQSQQ